MNFLECGNFTVVSKPILVERKKKTPTTMLITEKDLKVYEEKLEEKKKKEVSHYNEPFKPFKCTICNLRFASKRGLTRHGKSIHDVKRFECELCYKIYNGRDNLTYHMREIHKFYANQCRKCGLKVRTKACLKNHIQRIHQKEELKIKKIIVSSTAHDHPSQ